MYDWDIKIKQDCNYMALAHFINCPSWVFFYNIQYLYHLSCKYMYVESKYHSFPVSSFCKYLLYGLLQCSISLINYSTGIWWFSQFFSCLSCYYIRTQKVHIFAFCMYTWVCAFKTYNSKGKCKKNAFAKFKL